MRTTIALMAAGALALAIPAAAQTATSSTPATPTTPTATSGHVLVEWDLMSLGGDFLPGALTVDDRSSSRNSKVWFVTRASGTTGPRLYRLSPGLNMKKDSAAAKSWDLGAILTGGLKLRHSDDGRFAFVNVTTADVNGALVAIDTGDDSRITWTDRPFFDQMSDVAVDTRGGGIAVFTAAPFYDAADTVSNGVVQQLKPGYPQFLNGQWVVPAEVTRYPVGNGAGTCVDGPSPGSPCIPGITVDRRRGRPIFFSEPTFAPNGAIGEIDPTPVRCPTDPYATCARVRHWPLPTGTGAPRQIRADELGRIWGITSTGTLFSLEILRNCDRAIVTRHDPIGPGPEFLFAVAPAGGVIGFTDTDNNKVSMIFPEKTNQPITATTTFVKPVKKTIYGKRECVYPTQQPIYPRIAVANGLTYRNAGDGTYRETYIDTGVFQSGTGSPAASMSPTGMEPDGNWRTGAFFYGVGVSGGTNRIGHIEFKIDKHRDVECRKGDRDRDHDGIDDQNDDDVDGDGIPNALDNDNDNDGIPDALDSDANGDGIEDVYQSPAHRESKRSDSGQMAAGEAREYEMEYDAHSVLMTAIVEASDLTAPLSIQIVDDNGVVLLTTPPALGKVVATATPLLAGVYTVRVINGGTAPVNYKTTLVGRQIPY
jgi:hypothetical protein